MASQSSQLPRASLVNVWLTFFKLGLCSFGGPVAHIGYFHKELVQKQAWLSDSQFSQLLAICQFIPGPASSQLGFGIGLLRAGWLGALLAFIAFTLPSALLMFLFAYSISFFTSDIAIAALHGLKIVAVAVVADALWSMSKKLCNNTLKRCIAILCCCLLLLISSATAQISMIVLGALAGIVLCRETPSEAQEKFQLPYGQRSAIGFLSLALGLLFILTLPFEQPLMQIIALFYQAGSLVFGGGHVILPLLESSTVANGWISSADFLAGYGAAQAIPGPMFTFAAYLAALIPSDVSPALTATAALLAIFLPGFLLLLAALPLWQSLMHHNQALNALAGMNAAIVGILAATLYNPVFTSAIESNSDMVIAIMGFALLTLWRLSALYTVLWCVGASILSIYL